MALESLDPSPQQERPQGGRADARLQMSAWPAGRRLDRRLRQGREVEADDGNISPARERRRAGCRVERNMQDDAIVALICVMPMRQPVASTLVQLDITEEPRASLGFERGVAEVRSGAAVTPPLEDQAIGRARARAQRCA